MSPIVSPRSREGSRRPALRVLGGGEQRESPLDGLDASGPRRPALRTLRIVPDGGRESAPHVAPVLLAGADARGRATLRAELGATLAPHTRWVEADDVAGVLERAAHSRMVILAGDLDDADVESLIPLLGRRHPELPVICVDAPMPAAAAGGRG
jgi:hypothetical protein